MILIWVINLPVNNIASLTKLLIDKGSLNVLICPGVVNMLKRIRRAVISFYGGSLNLVE